MPTDFSDNWGRERKSCSDHKNVTTFPAFSGSHFSHLSRTPSLLIPLKKPASPASPLFAFPLLLANTEQQQTTATSLVPWKSRVSGEKKWRARMNLFPKLLFAKNWIPATTRTSKSILFHLKFPHQWRSRYYASFSFLFSNFYLSIFTFTVDNDLNILKSDYIILHSHLLWRTYFSVT